jgi:hypothetical protein
MPRLLSLGRAPGEQPEHGNEGGDDQHKEQKLRDHDPPTIPSKSSSNSSAMRNIALASKG